MANENKITPQKVEGLQHFPFKTFQEFRKANLEGLITIGINRGIAREWMWGGKYSPTFWKFVSMILHWIPFLLVLGFIIFALASKEFLLLLALPLFVIAYFLFNPSAIIFGIFRSGLIFLTFIGFLYGLFFGHQSILLITGVMLGIWYSEKILYSKSADILREEVLEHEDLLCALFQGRVLSIRFYNGDTYWVDFKEEGGKLTHYR